MIATVQMCVAGWLAIASYVVGEIKASFEVANFMFLTITH